VRVLHWQAGQPAGVANDQLRYSLDDHLGSSTLELDTQGGLISQERYYPFGGTAWWAARSAIEAKYKTIRYSGKERDASGLYYYGFRYYAPWLQRWLNPDSQTLDGLNLYAMVRNSPMNRIDPDGANSWNVVRKKYITKDRRRILKNEGVIRVRTVSKGIISVSITGSNAAFSKLGIDFDRHAATARRLTYLALDSNLFAGKVSGGDELITLSTASGGQIHAASKAETAPEAYINGGFFNMGGSMAGSFIQYASVGRNLIDGIEKPFANPPANYRDDYVKLTLHDGSFIHTAPQLTMSGIPQFTRQQSQLNAYQYVARETDRVGELGHAGDPNTRTGISLPQDNLNGGIRLAIGLNSGRKINFPQKSDEPGYKMDEWATVMARLDRMNKSSALELPAVSSYNLDGGDSSALGALDSAGTDLLRVNTGARPPRSIGNFLTFHRKCK
jgi:insecticidal toxin complex protein TccC